MENRTPAWPPRPKWSTVTDDERKTKQDPNAPPIGPMVASPETIKARPAIRANSTEPQTQAAFSGSSARQRVSEGEGPATQTTPASTAYGQRSLAGFLGNAAGMSAYRKEQLQQDTLGKPERGRSGPLPSARAPQENEYLLNYTALDSLRQTRPASRRPSDDRRYGK